MKGFNDFVKGTVTEVAVVQIDIGGHVHKRVFLYVVLHLVEYNIILGLL